MNKYKVYTPNTPNEEVHFKLQVASGGINLVAVKANGLAFPSGVVLTLRNDGRVQLAGGVNKNIGLNIGPTGKVTVMP